MRVVVVLIAFLVGTVSGLGLTWLSDETKVRSLDVAGDVGGDAYNLAAGFTYEF